MKYAMLFVLLLLGLRTLAQEISVDLENFNEVEVSRGLTVMFTPSNENRAIITGNSRDKVQLKVEGGVLKVKTSLTQLLKADNTVVNVNYKELQNLEARQNSKVEFCSRVTQPMIKIRASEGAYVFANIDVENLVVNANTGGNLRMIGKAVTQEIDVTAGGEFRGENLKGEKVSINLNGGGNAYVFATKHLNAAVRAGGHVYFYGDPEKIEEKTSFGGTIRKMK